MTEGQSRLWTQIKKTQDELRESELWDDILMAAETNEALREALDKVMVIYFLSKKGS